MESNSWRGFFTELLWLSIDFLESLDIRGLAGHIVRNNINFRTDLDGLFYTEIDRQHFDRYENN